MLNICKIAVRNLMRRRRRTLLTSSLITVGVIFVLVFISISGAFKSMMIGQITDSFLGHIQIHKRGYLASIDTLPLTMNLGPKAMEKVKKAINEIPEIEAYSPRIKFGGGFSNFVETTNIRLTGIDPDKELRAIPDFTKRILKGKVNEGKDFFKKGEILIPELLATGMKVKVGDTVVVIATNEDGSVNGKQFQVGAIIESVIGPGGRDGYIHMEDAMDILRMDEAEISQIAIRVKDYDKLHKVTGRLKSALSKELNKKNKPLFSIDTWEKIHPFSNIAKMIDLMTFFVTIMLIAIVLISIMNAMVTSVYERIREIGTIAAIGTAPRKIMALFVTEAFFLGLVSAVIGSVIGVAAIIIIDAAGPTFDFGRKTGHILTLTVNLQDMFMISLVVIAVSVIASFQPAYKASRMNPIDALRHV
ncbi:MAG: FtsX-like permease family protein [Planctomycetota bacterium]